MPFATFELWDDTLDTWDDAFDTWDLEVFSLATATASTRLVYSASASDRLVTEA